MSTISQLQIEQELKKLDSQFTKWRRQFHQLAEVGWCEYQTTYAIHQELSNLSFDLYIGEDVINTEGRMGLPSEKEDNWYYKRALEAGVPEEFLAKINKNRTGVIAVLDTGKPGSHTALRFDIDALPIFESADTDHFPAEHQFLSKQEGAMHACAHDGHITIGLGVAHLIHSLKDELSGKFTLIFQPAEEGSRGAKAIVANGCLEGVDDFICGHIGIHSLDVGTVAATTSQFLASTKINTRFTGKSAHAGINPQDGKNALLAGASAALNLQAISHHADGATRLNVGTMHAGQGRNIVADVANIEMETRGATVELNAYMEKEARRILMGTGSVYDVDVEIDIVGEGIQATCDDSWVDIVKQAAAKSGRELTVIDSLPLGGSEDATHMMNRVQEQGGKATYMLFGTPLSYGHHHPKFDFSEDTLSVAVEMVFRTLAEKMNGTIK